MNYLVASLFFFILYVGVYVYSTSGGFSAPIVSFAPVVLLIVLAALAGLSSYFGYQASKSGYVIGGRALFIAGILVTILFVVGAVLNLLSILWVRSF